MSYHETTTLDKGGWLYVSWESKDVATATGIAIPVAWESAHADSSSAQLPGCLGVRYHEPLPRFEGSHPHTQKLNPEED